MSEILVLHQAVGGEDAPDEQDVLVQAEAVRAALTSRGHEVSIAAVSLDLAALDARLSEPPDLVFNLVESLGGSGRLQHLVPSLLEARGIPFTGASADALRATASKLRSQQILAAAGLPVPDDDRSATRVIVKPIWEDASVGIGEHSVVSREGAEHMLRSKPRGEWFAEAYVEGREINLAILEGPSGPMLLPPAEILFVGDWGDRPRIVGYAAKWEPSSFEYQGSIRTFELASDDQPLLERLRALALAVWRAFELSGYARVDLRVRDDQPYVLEVNANPCLAPDAGFAGALEAAGISYVDAVELIATAGMRR